MRDPNIIIGAQGDCEKMQKMLEAAEGNSSEFSGPSRDGSGSVREPTESVMNCLLVEQGLHILRNFGRWGVDSSFPLQVSRDKLQIDDVTETDHSVDQALQGWLQSTLARQSSDIITMVQGDEKLAQNPLVHMLIDAASRCSTEVQTYCKDELLHWIGALGEVGSILTPQDMEATYLAGVLKSVLMKCGIPIAIHDQLFHPNPKKIDHLNYSDKKKQWTSNDAPNKAVSSETYDHNTAILPADTYCRLTADLIIDVCPGNSKMKGRMVPICLPSTLTTSDGKVLPEGSVAMVGHASSEMIQHCNQYFGEMTPIHQLSDFLLVPATQDVDVTLGIELSQPEDKIWRASLEQQFSRMKTVEGFPTVFRRNRFGQFIPPTVFERTFIQNAGSYVIPPVGEPLYKQGKLVTFSKGYGAHSFVSSVLNSSNMRKIISYVSKR